MCTALGACADRSHYCRQGSDGYHSSRIDCTSVSCRLPGQDRVWCEGDRALTQGMPCPPLLRQLTCLTVKLNLLKVFKHVFTTVSNATAQIIACYKKYVGYFIANTHTCTAHSVVHISHIRTQEATYVCALNVGSHCIFSLVRRYKSDIGSEFEGVVKIAFTLAQVRTPRTNAFYLELLRSLF